MHWKVQCLASTFGRFVFKWATARLTQQNDMCTQRRLRSAWASTQSAQSLRCPHEDTLSPKLPIECTAKTLIRMGKCSGWSASSLGTQVILLVLSCCGSNAVLSDYLSWDATKPTNRHLCTANLGIHLVWSESSLCILWVAKDLRLLQADSQDWSDWGFVQAGLAHRSFCWFCSALSHSSNTAKPTKWQVCLAKTQFSKPLHVNSKDISSLHRCACWSELTIHISCGRFCCDRFLF